MHRPAKVGNLQISVKAKQQVFRLNVTVNNFLRVTVHQCIGQLKYVLQHRNTDHNSLNMLMVSTVA